MQEWIVLMNMQESSEPVSYINSGHADAIFECFGIEQRFFLLCTNAMRHTNLIIFRWETCCPLNETGQVLCGQMSNKQHSSHTCYHFEKNSGEQPERKPTSDIVIFQYQLIYYLKTKLDHVYISFVSSILSLFL